MNIRRALRGGKVDAEMAMQLLLFSYAKIFSINPHDARHTPMKTIASMIQINGEVEKIKAEELDKMRQGV